MLVRTTAATIAVAASLIGSALAAQTAPPVASDAPHAMTAVDIAAWKSIRSTQLSHDGQWFAYVLAPNEGDAEVILKQVAAGGKEMRFPTGDAASSPALQLSPDGKWAAFLTWPKADAAAKLRKDRRPIQGKATLVNLATGEKKEIDKVRGMAFSGDSPRWNTLPSPIAS